MIEFRVNVKTVSEANAHEHWRKRQKRAKEQRLMAKFGGMATMYLPNANWFPCVVLLTRIGVRRLDSDNAVGACKHVRDGVADWLGIDDGDESKVTWQYGPQETSKDVGVRVQIMTPAEWEEMSEKRRKGAA